MFIKLFKVITEKRLPISEFYDYHCIYKRNGKRKKQSMKNGVTKPRKIFFVIKKYQEAPLC